MCRFVKLWVAIISFLLAFVNPAFLWVYLVFITACPILAPVLGFGSCCQTKCCSDKCPEECKKECEAKCAWGACTIA